MYRYIKFNYIKYNYVTCNLATILAAKLKKENWWGNNTGEGWTGSTQGENQEQDIGASIS